MDKQYKRTLVTSALPYANGPVHIGHLAGVYVPADIYTRFLRLCERPVAFIGGSDEHGVPITIKAKAEGVTPQDIVDRYHTIIRDSMKELGISFDVYSRTTSETHAATASEFFRRLYDKGVFVEKDSMQLYDEKAGQFLADRYVVGECPNCHAQGAYGDQCEKCGSSLNATDLINPVSAITGTTPVLRQTRHWYLPLDRYEEALRRWILEGHTEWKTNVYGQCKSWLDTGLQPRAVSRDLDWGVPVPVEGAEGKVLYVWFDAPIGYISNTKEIYPDTWEEWWKSDDTRLIHFIGKDNIVFHCIVFPAMLMAYGDNYQLPDNVPANEFLNLEGDKISTSRNWAVWLHEYLRDFPGKQDVLRYVLTANAPETKDNDFTWKDFQARNNNELVAILGNFVNRVMVLTHKYFGGEVPAAGALADVDTAALAEIKTATEALAEAIETFHFREGLRQAMEIARIGNRYLQETEPWKVSRTDMARVATILNTAVQICANIAIACEPFMPFMAHTLADDLRIADMKWSMLAGEAIVPAGTKLAEAHLLFEKIDDAAIDAQIERLQRIKEENRLKAWKPAPVQAEVDFDTFCRSDIRVATVTACEKVPKADKLLKFTLDDGTAEPRTIVSGIAAYYPEPDKLVGRQVCFIANLPPRKLRGIVSQGMILSAENSDGSLSLIAPSDTVAAGAQVK